MSLMPYLKALYGAALAFLGSLATGYSDNVMTTQEWITVAITTVTALGVIWGVPNAVKAIKGTPPAA